MMSYSNIYDAIPILSHARTEPVRTPKFSSDNASDKRQFCRLSLALSLPVRSHPKTDVIDPFLVLKHLLIICCSIKAEPLEFV